MSNEQIIQQAADQVGREIGRLQGKLFVAEAASESLRARIQRLDTVYQNLQAQLRTQTPPKPPVLSIDDAIEILRDKLPVLDPASQPVCFDVIDLLMHGATPENRKASIARMESYAWKQGEVIALAQQVVQCLRN